MRVCLRCLMGAMVILGAACGDDGGAPMDGGFDASVDPDAGMMIDAAMPDTGGGGGPPGSACSCDSDCTAVEGHPGICVLGICFTLASADCASGGSSGECGAGSRCWSLMGFDQPLCWPDCASYDCAGECDGDGSCAPTADTNCDASCGTVCSASTDWSCSADHPEDGDCPAGQVCQGGACVPFTCDDTVLEPNETQAAAQAFSAPTEGLQICSGDEDWFSFTPSTADVLQVVGVASHYGSGNLDVVLHDAAGDVMDEAWLRPEDYHEEEGRGPIDFEGYSMLGAPGSDTFFLDVFGVSGATNNYDLVFRTIPWTDGPSCSGAGYTARQCTAVSSGTFYTSELVMFPVSHGHDTYVGPGFTTVSGFSYTRTQYVPTSAQWGRRDLVMAIRYAMHVVQEEFPGTAPLGIGEIGMPNGTTPQGHPNFTHHYGTSADVSYFIRADAMREWGQLAYRQICNDAARLDDWSCVDTDGSRGQYGECVTGCGDGHIVDIPRTARFLAAIAESGHLRVYGVDTSVDDELAAELSRLSSMGVAGASTARSRMASADTDGSWVWHFNHMHISFE